MRCEPSADGVVLVFLCFLFSFLFFGFFFLFFLLLSIFPAVEFPFAVTLAPEPPRL